MLIPLDADQWLENADREPIRAQRKLGPESTSLRGSQLCQIRIGTPAPPMFGTEPPHS